MKMGLYGWLAGKGGTGLVEQHDRQRGDSRDRTADEEENVSFEFYSSLMIILPMDRIV